MLGKSIVTLAVEKSPDGQINLNLSTGVEEETAVTSKAVANIGKVNTVHLALEMDFISKKGRCAYSTDGQEWTGIGEQFPLMWDWRTGTFQGQQYALFCYNPEPSSRYLDVDSFRFIDLQLKK